MFKFIKSMSWFIKKNWWRYLLVIFFGLILAFLNVLPVRIIGSLTKAIEEGNVTRDYLIYDVNNNTDNNISLYHIRKFFEGASKHKNDLSTYDICMYNNFRMILKTYLNNFIR